MSALGSVLQVNAFKYLSNKLFTYYTNGFQSQQKKVKACLYIFYTSSIIITKEINKKKKLHFSFIYDFKWRKVEKH